MPEDYNDFLDDDDSRKVSKSVDRQKLAEAVAHAVSSAMREELSKIRNENAAHNEESIAHHKEDHEFISEHREFIRTFVERESRKNRLREVVTEKLVTGGAWAIIVFLAYSSWDFIKNQLK